MKKFELWSLYLCKHEPHVRGMYIFIFPGTGANRSIKILARGRLVCCMLNAQHARISREICVSLFLSHWSLFIHLGADQHESKNINALFWVLFARSKRSLIPLWDTSHLDFWWVPPPPPLTRTRSIESEMEITTANSFRTRAQEFVCVRHSYL